MDIINNICQTWQRWNGDTFASGVYMAAVIVLVLLVIYVLLRILIWSIGRKCRVNKIMITGEKGDIIIAENAIIDTVRSVMPEFPEINAGKIRISRRGKKYFMEMHVCYHPGKNSLNDSCEALREKIKEVLAARLHVDSIVRIDIRVDRLETEC